MIKSPIRSQMGTPRNAASTASCVISGNSVVRSSPRYRMLMAKRAASAAFAGLDGGVGTGLSRGGRRLMPKREHVTCSEPTVTPISSAISSRRLPRSTRFLICSMRSGVNLTSRPRLISTGLTHRPCASAAHPYRSRNAVRNLLRNGSIRYSKAVRSFVGMMTSVFMPEATAPRYFSGMFSSGTSTSAR